jgi:hypothetical protein
MLIKILSNNNKNIYQFNKNKNQFNTKNIKIIKLMRKINCPKNLSIKEKIISLNS